MTDDPLAMKYWTVEEVADLLNVHKMTIYRAISAGKLRAIYPGLAGRGSMVRVPENELRAWLAACNGAPA